MSVYLQIKELDVRKPYDSDKYMMTKLVGCLIYAKVLKLSRFSFYYCTSRHTWNNTAINIYQSINKL